MKKVSLSSVILFILLILISGCTDRKQAQKYKKIPDTCIKYFDGCNTCQKEPDGRTTCTLRECNKDEYTEPKCLD